MTTTHEPAALGFSSSQRRPTAHGGRPPSVLVRFFEE